MEIIEIEDSRQFCQGCLKEFKVSILEQIDEELIKEEIKLNQDERYEYEDNMIEIRQLKTENRRLRDKLKSIRK